jgi:hypothetical protein
MAGRDAAIQDVKTLAIQVPFSKKGCSVFVAQLLKNDSPPGGKIRWKDSVHFD